MKQEMIPAHIVIPMAGLGQRMASIAEEIPKMLYRPTEGQTLLELSIEGIASVFPNSQWTFVALQEHAERYNIENYCRQIVPNAHSVVIKLIDSPTRGQLATALEALTNVSSRLLVIHNCDTYIRLENFQTDILSLWDFIVPTFKSSDPAYSYCEINESNGQITRVAEKIPLYGDQASSGTYIFADESKFADIAKSVLASPLASNKSEYYISLVLEKMVHIGQRGTILSLTECVPLGTPEEVRNAIRTNWHGFVRHKNKNYIKNLKRHSGSSGAILFPRHGQLIKRDVGVGTIRLKNQGFWYWKLDENAAKKFPGVAGFEWSPFSAQIEMENLNSRELSELILDDACKIPTAIKVLENVLFYLRDTLYIAQNAPQISIDFWINLCEQASLRLEEVEKAGNTQICAALNVPLLNGKQIPTARDLIQLVLKKINSLDNTIFVRAHGDVHTGNILVSEKGDVHLIDPRGVFARNLLSTSVIYDFGKLLHDLHGCYSLIRAGNYSFKLFNNNKIEISLFRTKEYESYRQLLLFFQSWVETEWSNKSDIVGAFLAEGLLLFSLLPFHMKFSKRASAFATLGRIAIYRWLVWSDSEEPVKNLFCELDI